MDTRKKTCSVLVRLSEEEMEDLIAKSKKAGLSRSAYCRMALKKSQIKGVPTVDTGRLILVLTRICCELNRLQSQARQQQDDGLEETIRETLRNNETALQEIFRAYGVAY